MSEFKTLKPPEEFDFPFKPYPIQHDFMKQLYEVVERKKLGIFESPTGTGKSLSIICGALRWLKDHNINDRNSLSEEIATLEVEKQKLASETTDWLSSQAQEIEIRRKLDVLKIESNNLKEYDEKIKTLYSKKKTKIDKSKKWYSSKKDVPDKDENIEPDKDENIEEDDMLLEDDLKSYDSENDGSDEEANKKYEPVKVYICSRTHSQLSQFVGEIIKSPYGQDIRVVSLSSRQNYCINPSVNRLKNVALINERCLDMQKNQTKTTRSDPGGKVTKRKKGITCKCTYYKQQNIDELRDSALLEVQDVEDLVASGKKLNACPYYASRKAAEDAEVVLVPYNTILHKATREANGIKIKNNVIIIDEAHNLLEAMAQMYSSEVSYEQLHHCHQQLKNYKAKYNTRFSAFNLLCINQILFITSKLKDKLEVKIEEKVESKTEIFTIGAFVLMAEIDNYNMFKLIKFCKDSKISQKLHSFANKYPHTEETTDKSVKKGIKEFLLSIENRKVAISNSESEKSVQEMKSTPPPTNPILAIVSFFEALTYCYEDGRILVQKSNNKKQRKYNFLLLNPATHFKEIVKDAQAVIVAGGTMKPTTEFRDRLFISAGASPDRIVEFSCDHIIPPEHILPIILTKGPKQETLLFNFENRLLMGSNLKNVMLEACKKVKGGIVVFFPSYKYENWVWQQIKDSDFGRPIFREPQDSTSVDSVLESYAKVIQKPNSPGALMLSVVGGKLSEGLNFSDDLGRCVIVVGLPYANIYAPDLKEKMGYFDKLEGSGSGQRFYEGLCMKAVNQCIGRAVRHRNDYATVLLLDERYNRTATKNALPGWIKRSLRTCEFTEAFNLVDKFFQDRRKS